MQALAIRLQLVYFGDAIPTPRGNEYITSLCKIIYRLSELQGLILHSAITMTYTTGTTIGSLGRRKLYDLKDRYDTDLSLLHTYTPARASRTVATDYMREFCKVCYQHAPQADGHHLQ